MSSSTNIKKTGLKPGRKEKKELPPLEERLRRLYKSLSSQIDGGHLGNAGKTCDKLLRLEPTDRLALQTKISLLLQTDQYSAALEVLEKGTRTDDDLEFQRAYALYRLNRIEEAREVVEAFKERVPRVRHLEAQINFRDGRYHAAHDIYTELLDAATNADEYEDITQNLSTVQQHLDFIDGTTGGWLSALDKLPRSVANGIENAGVPLAAIAPTSGTTAAAASQVIQSEEAPSSKKPRKSRIPAGVIPGVTPPPDPERWIKKSERSAYNAGHGKRKSGRGGGGGASQGISLDGLGTQAPSVGGQSRAGSKAKKKK